MKKYKCFILGFICATFLTGIFGSAVIASIKQYIMEEAPYPILIDGKEYKNDELPVLTWEGNTYVPLRAFSEITNTAIEWNSELKQVEMSKSAIMDKPTVDDSGVIVDEEKLYIEAPVELGKFYDYEGQEFSAFNGQRYVLFDGKKYINYSDVNDELELAYRQSNRKNHYMVAGPTYPYKVFDILDDNKIIIDNIANIRFVLKDSTGTSRTDNYIDLDVYLYQILPLMEQD